MKSSWENATDLIVGISNVEQDVLESVGACDKQVLSVRHHVNGTEHLIKSKQLNTNTCFFVLYFRISLWLCGRVCYFKPFFKSFWPYLQWTSLHFVENQESVCHNLSFIMEIFGAFLQVMSWCKPLHEFWMIAIHRKCYRSQFSGIISFSRNKCKIRGRKIRNLFSLRSFKLAWTNKM